MPPHVQRDVVPLVRSLGRTRLIKTSLVRDLLGVYSHRRVYDFMIEMERAGVLVREPGRKRWRLA